jgi:predicted AAA+ superfamily ATPase
MIVERSLLPHLKKMLEKFPVLSLTGPRQSGKTTLLRSAFPAYTYFNLERPDHRMLIMEDPVGFLKIRVRELSSMKHKICRNYSAISNCLPMNEMLPGNTSCLVRKVF